jgi:hypothetical protein
MIVKFLSSAATFKGVSYNTRKIDKNKGELMKVSGFGPLQGMNGLRPKDYINYLKMVSSQNKRLKLPQLHVAISAKGRSHGKHELTEIAVNWLKEMGYCDQPYLVIFHKDTGNNHVHVVSSRVDKTGKKINSAFERIRGMTAIQKVLGMDEVEQAKADLAAALTYKFSTKPQFMMILEAKGYAIRQQDGKYELIKFGKKLLDLEVAVVGKLADEHEPDHKRAAQLTVIFHRYRYLYDTQLVADTVPLPGGAEKLKATYSSPFAEFIKASFGVELIFHGQPGKLPYGYTILDHDKKLAFKGAEVMDLAVLGESVYVAAEREIKKTEHAVPTKDHQVLAETWFAEDASSHATETAFPDYPANEAFHAPDPSVDVSIADDIDDEAIHGRNRQRKRQARTNTR